MSLRFAVSRNNFITRLLSSTGLGHPIHERANPTHFNLHYIAGLHTRDSRGRSGRDQVSGVQCHDLRDVPYKKGDRKGHVGSVTFLFYFAVETRLDADIRRIDFRLNPRSHGTKRVKRLAACELNVFALQIARGDIVETRVAKDITQRIVAARDLACTPANHDPKLTFVFDLLRRPW